jgi:hypothetical protein
MNSQTAYDLWAPRQSLWSAWAKPVLFAHLPRARVALPPLPAPNVRWVPSPVARRAIVVDLPGVEAVAMGLALAARGYRPVPLFNACPPPSPVHMAPPVAVIDVDSILTALVDGCNQLNRVRLPDNAPPAFLLDSLRQQPTRPVGAGLFDNRSVVFVTDFPSATFLTAQGIQQVILVRQHRQGLERDLTYVLQTWQKAGLALQLMALGDRTQPEPLTLPRLGWLTGLWIRLSAWFGLRRNQSGGFGSFVPESSSG